MKINIKSARRPNTLRKQIRISPEANQLFDAFATENELSYSAALETLGLVGLEADQAHILIPVMRELVPAVVQRLLVEQGQKMGDLLVWQTIAARHNLSLLQLVTGRLLRNMEQQNPEQFDEMILRPDSKLWSDRVENVLQYLSYAAEADALTDVRHLQRRLERLRRKHRHTMQEDADV